MIRKMLMAGGGVVLVTVVLVGRDAYSYLRTSAGYVTDAVQEAVPIEFQIDRARDMIDDLVPEVRKNMHLIAKEEVEVQQLDRQIAEGQLRLAREKKQLLQLKTDAASGRTSFEYAGRRYTLDEVRADLAARFERYKTAETTAASWREVRDARQKSLAAAQQKLESMLASKRQLQVDVENLEARLQTISAAKAGSGCQFDESRLGRVKQLVAGLRTRLDVAERLAGAEITCHAEIPLDKVVPENIVQQVSEHFTKK
ncbi:MAG: hypothetical protein ABFC77_15905 [Thermoguttaceae bacterium]